MYKTANFQKKLLATLVASSALGLSSFAFAQEEGDEVVVTGIKASLTAAMDIKRDAVGVVDAINAEDIGKMPDSNLAESLQRISGLSISRNNGEGSKVTVRGIDPALNMITLNGRVMPAVTQGGTGDTASRAYDFSNLASESISGVDVYKTGKADVAGGGLGASINIKTIRPLDAGNKATFGAKAVQDESVRFGSGTGAKYTPEVSGLYSWVNEDANFGVALNASHQERESARSGGNVVKWTTFQAGKATEGTLDGTLPSSALITNAPAAPTYNQDGSLKTAGQLYSLPSDLRYQLEDITRTRENAQLTLQFKPIESVTGTVDYTYSENESSAARSQQSTWYNTSAISAITFDNGVVKSPLIYEEKYSGGKDVSFAQEAFDTKSVSNSFGVNLEWEATDDLKLALDYHNSSAESLSTSAQAGLNANIVTKNYADFRKDVPVMGVEFDDGAKGNDIIDGADISGAMANFGRGFQRTEVQELQLSGSYALGDLAFFTESTIDAGIADRANSNYSTSGDGDSGNRITMGNWGGIDPAEFGSDWPNYFTAHDFGSSYADASDTRNDSKFLSNGLRADINKIADKMEYMHTKALTAVNVSGIWVRSDVDFSGQQKVANIVATQKAALSPLESQFKTDTDVVKASNQTDAQKAAAIKALTTTFEAAIKPINTTAAADIAKLGVTTQVNPDNFKDFPNGKFAYAGNDKVNRLIEEDVTAVYTQFKGAFELAGMPAHALLGIRYETTDVTSTGAAKKPETLVWTSDNDWTTEYSNKGVTPVVVESSYNNFLPNLDLDVSPTDDIKVRLSYSETMGRAAYQFMSSVATLESVYAKTASAGNARLKPMESQNLDLSAEWYYNDSSYVSAGVFSKKVSNFIGTGVEYMPHYGLLDVRSGPRFKAAVDALTGSDKIDEGKQWEQILKNAGVTTPTVGTHTITANNTDPELQWATTLPSNNKDATIDGVELGIQHFFGESGFGVQANATFVSTDAEFDDTVDTRKVAQFAMIGASDSFNVVGIYENNGFQTRIAYNWRDAFLNSTNQAGNNEPSYTKAFGTVDLTMGYELNENVTFTLEGLNILGENSLDYGRSETQVNTFEDLSARYTAGVRYTF